jgi:hypothetical protein
MQREPNRLRQDKSRKVRSVGTLAIQVRCKHFEYSAHIAYFGNAPLLLSFRHLAAVRWTRNDDFRIRLTAHRQIASGRALARLEAMIAWRQSFAQATMAWTDQTGPSARQSTPAGARSFDSDCLSV